MMAKQLIFIIIVLSSWGANAQLYIGFSSDLGNSLIITPNPNSLLKSPLAPYGSLIFIKQEEINERWCLQYGGSIGILGYNLYARQIDTLNDDPSFYDRYPIYNTPFVNGHLSFGRIFEIKGKRVLVMAGGGASYFLDTFGVGSKGGTSTWNGTNFERIFEYDIGLINRRAKGFAEASLQMNLNKWCLIGVKFRSHFSTSLSGNYKFYHTTQDYSGRLAMTPRTFSLLFLVKISQ